jgi:hypothetical protein
LKEQKSEDEKRAKLYGKGKKRKKIEGKEEKSRERGKNVLS